MSKIEVAPGSSQTHSLGLVERIASRLIGYLDFVFRVRVGAQLAALESVENVALLRAHFVVHDGLGNTIWRASAKSPMSFEQPTELSAPVEQDTDHVTVPGIEVGERGVYVPGAVGVGVHGFEGKPSSQVELE